MSIEQINKQKIYKRWCELIGHRAFLDKMNHLISLDSFPQVVLIEGRKGIGKSMVAGTLAARHFCDHGTACGQCEGCIWVKSGNHNDILFYEDDGENLKIAEAKKFQEHLEIEPDLSAMPHPYLKPKRMVVLPDVDRFNETAINKLLKILEDIPDNARVVFTTSRKNLLLDTFRSRCVTFRLAPPTIEEGQTIVQKILQEKGKDVIGTEQIASVLKRCSRSPGKALEHIQLLSEGSRIQDRWDELLMLRKVPEILQKAQEISSDKSVDAGNLSFELELALNRKYRRLIDQGGPSQVLDPVQTSLRRQLLNDLKYYGYKRKIKLNSQLSIEAVGLNNAGFGQC